MTEQERLIQANLEALSSDEAGGEVVCKGYGSVICPYNQIWVYSVE